MKAIVALSILAVLNMFFGVRKMKKVLLPLIFVGLIITMILNIREWGTSVHYFNEMFIADNFSIAFSSVLILTLIHISEPTRRTPISYAVFCLKKKKTSTPNIINKKKYS